MRLKYFLIIRSELKWPNRETLKPVLALRYQAFYKGVDRMKTRKGCAKSMHYTGEAPEFRLNPYSGNALDRDRGLAYRWHPGTGVMPAPGFREQIGSLFVVVFFRGGAGKIQGQGEDELCKRRVGLNLRLKLTVIRD